MNFYKEPSAKGIQPTVLYSTNTGIFRYTEYFLKVKKFLETFNSIVSHNYVNWYQSLERSTICFQSRITDMLAFTNLPAIAANQPQDY